MSTEVIPSQQNGAFLPISGDNALKIPYMRSNSYLHNPTSTIIYIKEGDKQKGGAAGRQEEDGIDNLKPETRSQFLIRRIFIGKDDYEEKQEIKKYKKRNFVKKEIRRHLAEFIGTFFIVFFIAGIQTNQDVHPTALANIDKGLTSGFILVGLIYCFGKISGAHFNPCVTLAFLLRGSFGFIRSITYIIIQFAGAVSGAAVLYGLFGHVNIMGTTEPNDISNQVAFGIEIILTFVLISVVLSTTENAELLGPTSAIAVGLTFGAIELWGWNWSGASVNPWRTIGPTLISGDGWNTYWIYIIGPIIGTIIAVILQRVMVTGSKRKDIEEIGKGHGKVGH